MTSFVPRLRGSFEIKGGDEIQKLFHELGAELIPEVRKAMSEELEKPLEAARNLVPVDTGLTKETLIKRVSTRQGNVVGMVGVRKINKKQREKLRMKYEAKGIVGQLYDAFYAVFTNYGTKFQPPQRWMNKAFDQEVEPFVEDFTARVFRRCSDKLQQKQGANQ